MFKGSFVAIVTPFKNASVDEEALKKLIDRQIEGGISGIVPCGTTGSSPTLSHDEHKKVVELTVKHVAGRVKVIAGSGSNSTKEAISLTKHAQGAGADGALVITPYYNKPTQKGLYKHFEAVATQTNIPIVLYNVPGRTGVNLAVDTIVELSQLKNIVAIKEASGSLEKVSQIVAKTDLSVLSGEDALTYPMILIGGKGVISVTANVMPKELSKMVDCALNGNTEEGLKLHKQLFSVSQKMFIETNPIPVKTALSMMGLIEEEFRLPLCEMSESNKEILKEELQKQQLI